MLSRSAVLPPEAVTSRVALLAWAQAITFGSLQGGLMHNLCMVWPWHIPDRNPCRVAVSWQLSGVICLFAGIDSIGLQHSRTYRRGKGRDGFPSSGSLKQDQDVDSFSHTSRQHSCIMLHRSLSWSQFVSHHVSSVSV